MLSPCFASPVDGKPMLLTPEESIQIQNKIGADIIMALDDVVKTTTTGPRVQEAMHRTLRWIDRCVAGTLTLPRIHDPMNKVFLALSREVWILNSERNVWKVLLHAISRGSYAIGGLAGGESKDSFWRVVAQCTAALPKDKPRYVMQCSGSTENVSKVALVNLTPVSLLLGDIGRGISVRYRRLQRAWCRHDCVYPTRTARFGSALIPEGILKLKNANMANDYGPLDASCACMVCKQYTRACLHTLVTKEALGAQLVSCHNIAYMMKLSQDLHTSILENRFPKFLQNFMKVQFPKGDVPAWVRDAMEVAGVDISECCTQ